MSQQRYILVETAQGLELQDTQNKRIKPLRVDFTAGANWHRYQYGGGKGQLIAKAVGLQKYKNPTILDVTAGLGADAFALACLGCKMTLLERSEIVAALLADGLQRAQKEDWFCELKMELIQQSSIEYLKTLAKDEFDVIYIDPMYPHSNRTALVKKEMRILRELVGDDDDADALLLLALKKAKRRVVVKRPRLAPFLADQNPDHQYKGKSSRFDVYVV
ncbi:MAG: class I SAM-dependent methyltransferase [Gammaproteobacteria bacterium]|nr:class I SAM-dependent methyltransferase [Gammaproteobacteria bacterium]